MYGVGRNSGRNVSRLLEQTFARELLPEYDHGRELPIDRGLIPSSRAEASFDLGQCRPSRGCALRSRIAHELSREWTPSIAQPLSRVKSKVRRSATFFHRARSQPRRELPCGSLISPLRRRCPVVAPLGKRIRVRSPSIWRKPEMSVRCPANAHASGSGTACNPAGRAIT